LRSDTDLARKPSFAPSVRDAAAIWEAAKSLAFSPLDKEGRPPIQHFNRQEWWLDGEDSRGTRSECVELRYVNSRGFCHVIAAHAASVRLYLLTNNRWTANMQVVQASGLSTYRHGRLRLEAPVTHIGFGKVVRFRIAAMSGAVVSTS
jgi:hypothetical protein